MSDDKQVGDYLGNVPCDDCGSKDNLSLYVKVDDKGENYVDGYCWGKCKLDGDGYKSREKVEEMGYTDEEKIAGKVSRPKLTQEQIQFMLDQIAEYPIRGIKQRRIKKDTAERYGMRCEMHGDEISSVWFPSTVNGNLTGYKGKAIAAKWKEPYKARGSVKKTNELFGQSLFPKGGKFLVLTEGELDAMAFYQALSERSGGKYETACLSVNNGSGSTEAQIRANYEYISSFDQVLVAFDNDEPGKEAANVALRLLKPSQAYRVNLTHYKDANEYVKRGKEGLLIDAFWKAEKFTPAGIVGSSGTFDALVQRAKHVKIELPAFAEDLNLMLNGGPALGEITTIAAASSVGKTTLMNEFVYHFIMNAPYKVGIISLESDVGELTENLMSLHMNVKLAKMPDNEKLRMFHTTEFKENYRTLTLTENGEDRYYILDHQGAVMDDELMKKIEFLVKVKDCKIIILDPLTLAMSGKQNDGMDMFMSDLLRFVKREKISHFNVVHVRKNQSGSKANSTGAEIHEEDIKGSGSIFQVSMNNILLMRDKENPDPRIRNTTKAVMSKNRRCGETGPAGYWYYNSKTSRMEKGSDPHADYEDAMREFEELGAFVDSNADVVGLDEAEVVDYTTGEIKWETPD